MGFLYIKWKCIENLKSMVKVRAESDYLLKHYGQKSILNFQYTSFDIKKPHIGANFQTADALAWRFL